MKEPIKVVVVLSGGMDSYTVMHKALMENREVFAINFHYGQKHVIEQSFAWQACISAEVPLKQVDISSMNALIDKSALTNPFIDVPKGHYEDESMKDTVVPNRNMMLLSMATAYAINIGATEVWYGAHSGDHAIYPDCRPQFAHAMQVALDVCDYNPIKLVVPFLDGNKETILNYGLGIGLDYSETWTCYDPQQSKADPINPNDTVKACGICGSCQERLEAFSAVGQTDPLEYV